MSTLRQYLQDTSDIETYLDKLDTIKQDVVILLAVRDTPGSKMQKEVLKKIHSIGFENFSTQLWVMYTGAICYGKKVLDQRGEDPEEQIEADFKMGNCSFRLISAAWKNGNYASILVKGIDFSCNKRGINIVVYDVENDRPLDSINYDSHSENKSFVRDERIFDKKEWIETKKKKDVCVAGVWYGSNYGSILNGYALYTLLKQQGKSVLLLQKPDASVDDVELRESTHNYKFIHEVYDEDELSPRMSCHDVQLLNDCVDTFVAGSDQIWNYFISFSGLMYLPFVNSEKRRISFCTSFGKKSNHVPKDREMFVKDELQKYDAISVREFFGKEALRERYNIDSTVLQEPVFDIEKDVYLKLVEKSNFSSDSKYILAYILDPSDAKLEILFELGKRCKCDIITIPDGWYSIVHSSWDTYERRDEFPNMCVNMLVEDFLAAFSKAEFVVSDSFHGTCFAIIFEKRFISLSNLERGAERFDEVLGRFNMTSRLVRNIDDFEWKEEYLADIDYGPINKIIEKERIKAVEWLAKALNVQKAKKEENIKPIVKIKKKKDSNELIKQNPEFIKLKILGSVLFDYGIRHVILSPGGRDVPLVRLFENNQENFNIHRVTDERSAAYYGMGIATQLREPVVCVCTSGTAVSNYLPAVTEAFYTGIPLIVITADRMEIYHGQGEDQTITQRNLFKTVVKKEVTIPEGEGFRMEYQTRRDISDCILESTHNGFGPVHINIAIDNVAIGSGLLERDWKITPHKYRHINRLSRYDSDNRREDWLRELKKSQRIMIVYGQNAPLKNKQKEYVENFAKKFNCVILTDHISNLECMYSLKPYQSLFQISQQEFNEKLSPDILITVGGKRLMNDPLTFKIRGGLNDIRHWSVVPDGKVRDFYFRLTSVIEMNQDSFFEWFSEHAGVSVNDEVYYNAWRNLENNVKYVEEKKFNSLYVQSTFLPNIPPNSILHLGVGQSFIESRRYKINKDVEVYCNMGTNGIDGCTSTFMGQCVVVKDKLCFLLVGDLSFFYDMNSIWNKTYDSNIRILMVNNNGSGLLRHNNLRAITAVHNTSVRGWVESTGFEYIEAHSKEEYIDKLKYFLSEKAERALFFEVFTD